MTIKNIINILASFKKFSKSNRIRSKMEGIENKILKNNKSPVKSPGKTTKKRPFLGLSPLKDRTNVLPINYDRPFRVSVEGNIGAGKSTLIKYFQSYENVETYPEPIEAWRNVQGYNLLELMYTDINQWLKVFQNYVQLTRVQIQTSKPKSPSTVVQLFERSIQNNRFCFVEQAYTSGYLEGPDYALLDAWYKWIRDHIDIDLDLIVYLRTTPEVVFERMKARGRPEETKVTLQYLKELHDSHEMWLMSNNERFNTVPVLVLDADKNLEQIMQQYKDNEHRILGNKMFESPKIKKAKTVLAVRE